MDVEDFMRPISVGARSDFVTARAAARLSMLGRGPTVQQLADTAIFVASERGSGITASIVTVTSGVSGN
jgi:enoyl-[acyl-carrier-protein] reductase (NADH)